MGLFGLFKKKENSINRTTDNGVLGPTFFEGLTIHIDNPKDLLSHEWRRKLKTKTGQTKFKIKYYGELHNEYRNLIVRTDFAPSLIFAIDSINDEEVFCPCW
jgi:deoxyadenosine/deoxycytidine kinase